MELWEVGVLLAAGIGAGAINAVVVSEALERLRPLAAESLHAMFGLTMDAATERTLERLQGPPDQ